MVDHAKLQRQHLERTLLVAESSGDDEWAKQVRAELDDYKPRKRVAKKAEPEPEPVKKAEPKAELKAEKE